MRSRSSKKVLLKTCGEEEEPVKREESLLMGCAVRSTRLTILGLVRNQSERPGVKLLDGGDQRRDLRSRLRLSKRILPERSADDHARGVPHRGEEWRLKVARKRCVRSLGTTHACGETPGGTAGRTNHGRLSF